MSDIDSKQIYSDLGLNKTQSPNADTKSRSELGQAEFLELMTAQLKYQDPLKPMENGDFIAQMAQFGTVSGIGDLNTSFNNLNTAIQSNQALQASTMVGRDVMVPGNEASLPEAGTLTAAVDLKQPASQVVVDIKDANGQLVKRIDLGGQQQGLVEFEWNGVNAAGNPASPGRYTISAEVHQGEDVEAGEMFTTARVESVTLGQAGQELTLTVSDLGDIGMSQIRKIM